MTWQITSFTNAKIQFMTYQHPSWNDSDKYSYVKAITCREIWALVRPMYIRGVLTQGAFQRHFHVVLSLIWRRDVWRQVSLEATLCTSALKFTTNQRCLFYFVQTTLSFSTSIFTTMGNVETTLWMWSFEKKVKIKPWTSKTSLDSKHFSFLRGICKRIFAEPQKSLKHQIYWITKILFKPSHFVKCQQVFNFTRRLVQAHYDYLSFSSIYIF